MDANRQLSVHVSRALDCLGKHQDMIKFRVEIFKQNQQLLTGSYNGFGECIISGSKGEGLTSWYESDIDAMFVYNDVICSTDTSSLRQFKDVTIFEADEQYTSPGYTKLRLYRFEDTAHSSLVRDSLIKGRSGQLYLSSDRFVERFKYQFKKKRPGQFLDRSGPSQPYSILYQLQDSVGAYRCICPEITQSFNTRPRYNEWPSNDQLAEISTLDGHVVPVGYKGSDTACLEWRICYTKAEHFLMCSLNDTQTKLYILLKMVAKTYLNSTSKEITSYVLKNIVLWLAECCDIDTFKKELLFDRIFQALEFLRKCIINNNLPSYMIPERNLFSEKLDLVQRQKLVILLTELMHEGGRLLMGCERLYSTMFVLYYEPAVAEQYRCKRDMIEKLCLWLWNKHKEKMTYCDGDIRQTIMLMHTGEDSGQNYNVFITLVCLYLPDLQTLRQQGHGILSIVSIFQQRYRQWLS